MVDPDDLDDGKRWAELSKRTLDWMRENMSEAKFAEVKEKIELAQLDTEETKVRICELVISGKPLSALSELMSWVQVQDVRIGESVVERGVEIGRIRDEIGELRDQSRQLKDEVERLRKRAT